MTGDRTGYDIRQGSTMIAERMEGDPMDNAPFAHPATGDRLETLADFQRAIDQVERDIQERAGALYNLRRRLREEMTDRFEPELPPRRARTPTQEKVARCPRCGTSYSEELS